MGRRPRGAHRSRRVAGRLREILRHAPGKAIAVKSHAQARGDAQEAARAAAEIVLWSERRMGELLSEELEHGGDRKSGSRSPSVTLIQAGVTRNESSAFQRMAAVPQKRFEEELAFVRESEMTPTRAAILRVAKDIKTAHAKERVAG